MSDAQVRSAPTTVFGTLRQLGPGLIIAAAIVGSGELIATTITGAKAGIVLLWLIILGCTIKVFTQIEIGRYTLISGMPTLSSLNQVPGPRLGKRGNWLVWYWFVMWFCSIAQLGGIVGGVGQTVALIQPMTRQGAEFQAISKMRSQSDVARAVGMLDQNVEQREIIQRLENDYRSKHGAHRSDPNRLKPPNDDRLWAIPIAFGTSLLLFWGRYSLIQLLSTLLVAAFTFITVGTMVGLQFMPTWKITLSELAYGLSFQFPGGASSMTMALATLGIIGVGAAELIQYPYWCLEKGYARWTGPNDGSPEWIARAKGWLRVMQWDAWISMVIYTIATIAFYCLGVAILHRTGMIPKDSELIQTLAVMYEPVFSSWAPPIFLAGAFVVLYSTFFVANASHALTFADGMAVVGLIQNNTTTTRRAAAILRGLFPLFCLGIYWLIPEPIKLVKLSGIVQAIMLPMLFIGAAYFRYRKCLPQLAPSRLWDVGFWISGVVLVVIGTATLWFNWVELKALISPAL